MNTTTNGFQPAGCAMAELWLCYGCAACWLCCLRARCPLAAAPLRWWNTFSRSGFVAFVAQGGGEVTRRRKGTGAAVHLVMPRYSNDEPCGYHGNLHASAHHGAVHTWAMSRAGTMATCTATCDGLHGRQLTERDQRLLTPKRECGVLWRHLPAQQVLGERRCAPSLACKCPPRRSRPLPHR